MSGTSVSTHGVVGGKIRFTHFDNFSSIQLYFSDEEGKNLLDITLFLQDAVAVGKVLQQLSTATEQLRYADK